MESEEKTEKVEEKEVEKSVQEVTPLPVSRVSRNVSFIAVQNFIKQ